MESMDFYSNLGSYDSSTYGDNLTSFGGNSANYSGTNASNTSCGLIALNHLARYHSAPTSVLQGLLLDDDDDDDGGSGGGGGGGYGDGNLLDISENSELSRLLNDGIGSFASLIDPPPKPTQIHSNSSNSLMNPSSTTTTNHHNLELNPPLNHNLKLNHAHYGNPPDDQIHYNIAPSHQDVANLTNQTLISLNAQMNQKLLNQDRLINPQISLFNHTNNNNIMISNTSSSSSTNHSPTLSSISEQDPITINNEDQVISLIPSNITIDQGKQSTQYQNHSPNLHSNPNPNLNPNLNGNLNPNPNPSVDSLPNLYKSRPPQGPMMMLPNISNTMKPSGGLIRHSSSPAHFLSKMAMEEMASVDHELNGISSSGAYNPHGQRKRGRGGVLEVPDKNNIQQQFGQQQVSMSPPLLTSEGLSPPNHVSCFDDIDGSIVDSVLCKARAKRGHATHPRSIAERVRRTKISDRIKKLQDLVPNLDKQANTADMLDEIVEYVKVLQQKIKDLSMDPPMCNCVRQQEQAI